MAKENTTSIGFEEKIWKAADILRGNLSASQYEGVVLGRTFHAYQSGTLQDEQGFCAVCTTEQIAQQDYILTPGRYVGIAEDEGDGEPFTDKMARLTDSLSQLFKESREQEKEIRKQLKMIGWEV